ncbi:MAG: hypothetical protein QXY07_00290 [Candidatus Bathyarchaeia archaeon]
MKSIKIEDDIYIKLLKLKAALTAQDAKPRTFSDIIKELLDHYEKTVL